MDYDQYDVRIEFNGYTLEFPKMDIPKVYRGNDQDIYNWIMEDILVEWDFVEES